MSPLYSFENALHYGYQLFGLERFCDISVYTSTKSRNAIGRFVFGREEDDGHVPRALARLDQLGRLEAVQPRHLDVEQGQRDIMLEQEFESLLAEPYIRGRELTTAVLGDRALGVTELVPKSGFYDFDAKYTDGMTEHVCPAQIPEDMVFRDVTERRKAQQAVLCVGLQLQDRHVVPDQFPDRGFFYRSDQFSLAKQGVPMVYAGVPQRVREERAKLALEAVGPLLGLAHRDDPVAGGDWLARARATGASILHVDEPKAGRLTIGEVLGVILANLALVPAGYLAVRASGTLINIGSTRERVYGDQATDPMGEE